MLKVTSIFLFVTTISLGLLALLTESRILFRLHVLILTLVAVVLAVFLCVLYAGIEDSTVAKANERYNKAFDKGKRLQDVEGITYVMKVERTLKCCGLNSSKDYEYGVLESCCTSASPCRGDDIHKIGCAEAFGKRLGNTMSNVLSVLSAALIFMACLIAYLFFFCYLLNRKRAHRQNALEAKEPDEEA